MRRGSSGGIVKGPTGKNAPCVTTPCACSRSDCATAVPFQWQIDSDSLTAITTALDVSGVGRTILTNVAGVTWDGSLVTTASCYWCIDPARGAGKDGIHLGGELRLDAAGHVTFNLYGLFRVDSSHLFPWVQLFTATGTCTGTSMSATLAVTPSTGITGAPSTITVRRVMGEADRWLASTSDNDYQIDTTAHEFRLGAGSNGVLRGMELPDKNSYIVTTGGDTLLNMSINTPETGDTGTYFQSRSSSSETYPPQPDDTDWDLVLHALKDCNVCAYVPEWDKMVVRVNGTRSTMNVWNLTFPDARTTCIIPFCGGWYFTFNNQNGVAAWRGIKVGGQTPAGRYYLAPFDQCGGTVSSLPFIDIEAYGGSYYADAWVAVTPSDGYPNLSESAQTVTFSLSVQTINRNGEIDGATWTVTDAADPTNVTSISPNGGFKPATITVTLKQNRNLTPYNSALDFGCTGPTVPLIQAGCTAAPSLPTSSVTVDGDGYASATLDYLCDDNTISWTAADSWIADVAISDNDDDATYTIEVYTDGSTPTSDRSTTVTITTHNGTVTLTVVQDA